MLALLLAAGVLGLPGTPTASTGDASPAARPFLAPHAAGTSAPTPKLPDGFHDNVAFSGLTHPTSVRFSPDGRIFVAEKSGLLKVFDSLSDPTATVVADLSGEVDDYWDRGLLGLALDPNFPTSPYVYLLYAYDAPPGGTAPVWNDACPSPPGPTTDGCVVSGKLVRLTLSGNTVTDTKVLISNQWCQQYPSHSIGDLVFGPDGKLYVSGGDGASFNWADYGQGGGSPGSPTVSNPCGDPPNPAGTGDAPPDAQGGALRSQSPGRPSGPALLNGAILRVDPATGDAAADNPNAGSTDANLRRIIAYGLRNPFRFTFRPGTSEIWAADVGWDTWEEINRKLSPTGPVTNFGWPCYEGTNAQPGYQSAGLDICSALYNAPGSVTGPYYTYAHSAAVVPGDGCSGAIGSSASAIGFYGGGSYPDSYDGALVFGDHSRNCIWAMLPGANGLPDPTRLQAFVTPAAGPVDIETGPSGDLYYVDFDGGTIHHISYTPTSGCADGSYHASYYNNMTLTGAPVLERCEAAPLSNDWGMGSPAPQVNPDQFSALWTGTFNFQPGVYTFTATTDDGMRVYVDGVGLIDAWHDQGPTTYSADISLSAGQHQVRIEYYENGGAATAHMDWELQTGGGPCGEGQFDAQYFPDQNLTGTPALRRCETGIDYNWGTGSPDPSLPDDAFSVRWSGQFQFSGGSYTFTAIADDGIRVYVDGFLVVDGWKNQPPTTYTTTTTLAPGPHLVRVEYYEATDAAQVHVSWQANSPNTAPTAAIDTPAPTLTYAVGDPISFSGHADDAEQTTLPPSELSWTLLIHHCTTPTDCHVHTVQSWNGVASGTLNAPDHDYPSHLELVLHATDAGGLQSTTSVTLQPKTVDLSFHTDPVGLTVGVGSGSSAAPFTKTVIQHSLNSVSAAPTQELNGKTYHFVSWSDGGASTHNLTAPASAATYTATYSEQITAPVSTQPPSLAGEAKQGQQLFAGVGGWSSATPLTFTFTWLRCPASGACQVILGATGSSYHVGAGDIGSRIQVRVTASNGAGSASALSSQTAVVVQVPRGRITSLRPGPALSRPHVAAHRRSKRVR